MPDGFCYEHIGDKYVRYDPNGGSEPKNLNNHNELVEYSERLLNPYFDFKDGKATQLAFVPQMVYDLDRQGGKGVYLYLLHNGYDNSQHIVKTLAAQSCKNSGQL